MGKHSGGSIGGNHGGHHGGYSHGGHHGGHHGHHHYGGHHGYNHYGGHHSTTIRCNAFSCFVFAIIAIIVAVVVVGLLIAPWDKNNKVELGLLETYIFKPSTTWNKQLELTSQNFGYVTAYKFASVPPLSPDKKTKSEHQVFGVEWNNFDSQSYYLISGSTLTVNFTSDRNIDFYVIKGSPQFTKWREGDQDVTYLYQTFGSVLTDRKFTMTTTDDIYVIWKNTLTQVEINVDAYIVIEMVSYDMSNALETCEFNTSVCTFSFSKGSSEVVALSAALSDDQNQIFVVDYKLDGRLNFYFAIFGGVVGACVIIGFLVFIIGIFVRRRNQYTSM
eukprot:TRINITY_DN4076_c0_g1_i2.p1 TRINITY_DN4076_c0_g1~~TRINITY_DN4076_c0_g1_i2.p1  ORF type:complete len:332 (-),score=82.44 TRINITY_DN4076_c0_g1_i2:44-1039(-)